MFAIAVLTFSRPSMMRRSMFFSRSPLLTICAGFPDQTNG